MIPKKIHSQQSQKQTKNKRLQTSPYNIKIPLSSKKKDQVSPLQNIYKKPFNIRRLTHHTEQVRIKNVENEVNNALDLGKINGSLDLRRVNPQKGNNSRVHTEKKSSSVYKNIKNLQTIDHQQNLIYKKYQYFTEFEKEQLIRYEVYYNGKRRINNIGQFTDSSGDAKIQIGDSIAYRYQVKKMLGKGSFGQVYKVFDHKRNQMQALKIIRNHPKFNNQSKIQIKILQQVQIADSHFKSNIVEMKHGFFFRGHACLVFQLLHINLYQFLRSFEFSGLSLDLIRRFAIQILQSLSLLKKLDIIHCDLKPQNILLKQENKTGIKVIDVGSGCYQPDQIYTYIQSRFYRAPEIILGIKYTHAIDIWSFGCILCELYTGYPIFPGENEDEQLQMIMEIFGKPPNEIIQAGSRSHKYFHQLQPKLKPNSRGRLRKPNSKKLNKVLHCDDTKFISFLEMCFKWCPNQRIQPSQALMHPWIIEGIPQQLRKQHLQQIYCNTIRNQG